MYSIYSDNNLIYDLRIEGYDILNSELNEELNKVSTLSFDLYDTNPNYDELVKLVSSIRLYKDNILMFKGRIIKDSQNMDNSKQVTCESGLAFLLDTIQKPYSFQGSTKTLFSKFLNNHNTQVGIFTLTTDVSVTENKHYFTYNATDSVYEQVEAPVVGNIATYYEAVGSQVIFIGKTTGGDLDNNDYIFSSSDSYQNTWDVIIDKLINLVGGYIYLEYGTNEKLIVNWVDDFTTLVNGEEALIISGQAIEFGENLIDLLIENDAESTCSVILPLGSDIKDANGNVTGKLDITSVNDNSPYLVNNDALAHYGWIVAPIEDTTWNDVTVASNLLTKAQNYLDNIAVMMKSKLELTAVDLSVLDKDIDDFSVGEYVTCKSEPHELNKEYLLNKKTTYLQNPESTKITLGEEISTLTGLQLNAKKTAGDLTVRIGIIEKEYVTNADVTEVKSEIITDTTSIVQNSESIVMQAQTDIVSYLNSLNQTLSTMQQTILTQTSEQFQMEFQKTGLQNDINAFSELVNSNNATLITLSQYIRFFEGQMEFGRSDSQVKLLLKNDKIYFKTGASEDTYITNNTLFTDIIIAEKQKMGNWNDELDENGNWNKKWVGEV